MSEQKEIYDNTDFSSFVEANIQGVYPKDGKQVSTGVSEQSNESVVHGPADVWAQKENLLKRIDSICFVCRFGPTAVPEQSIFHS